MDWDSDLIENINRRRTQERAAAPDMAKREDNLLQLMSRSLYGEKVHYALELLQNAEDADADSITFIFQEDKVIVANNGDVFDADDVDAISSVKPGRKRNKIGFFGVGFKSVFNITSTPQVISSYFNFQIENYIYPKPLSHIPDEAKHYYSKEQGSVFILPHSGGLPTTLELIEHFKQIDDKILLFLTQVKALHFINNVNDDKWSINKPQTEDEFILIRDGRTDQTTRWRVFHKDLPVSEKEVLVPEGKEGITQTRITVAFPSDESTKDAIKSPTVYCYLPTNKRSDMPFLVQADFVPTVGRGSIQDVNWNKWLLANIGAAAAEAVDQIKDDPYLGRELYNLIPLRDEVHEPLMSILSDAMYKSLRPLKIARTLHFHWKRSDECVIATQPEIPKIISQQDLIPLFRKTLSYADIELSRRAHAILTELGASILGEAEFVEFLSKQELIRKRKPAWFLNAYAYLNEVFDVDEKDYQGTFVWEEDKIELFSKLERTKFILTNEGNLVPLKDPNKPDMLICYPQNIDLSEVNLLFTEGEVVFLNKYFQLSTITRRKDPDPVEEEKRKKVHKFFDGIGVRVYFKQSHVIKSVILPKYSSGKYKEYNDMELYKYVNYIRNYWSTLESEVRNKKIKEAIFDEVKQTILLRAYTKKNGERIACYMPPGKIYFPKRYGKTELMEDLFQGVDGICFLHPYYLNREKHTKKKRKRRTKKTEYGWKRFAEILGVWSSPRIERNDDWISIRSKPGYEWVKKQYSPSGLHELQGDSLSDDTIRLIEYCSGLENAQASRERMNQLLQALSNNWSIYREHCRTTYKYKYNYERTKEINNSSFLNYLKSAEWIPTEDGDFCKPEEIYVYNRKNRYLLGEDKKYAKLTVNHTFLKDIGVNIEPTTLEVLGHLREYKERTPNFEKSKLEKFDAIYSFVGEKVEESGFDKEEMIKKIKKEFGENELLYIPRKDRSWWKPSEVFWKDHSRTFMNLRGYIEHNGKEIYSSKLKEFFFALGIPENPSVRQALALLEQLRAGENIDTLKKTVTKVYCYINDLIAHDGSVDIDWTQYSFLTKNTEFLPAKDIFFEDDEDFSKEFYDKANFVFLPHTSWVNLRTFFQQAGFNSFLDHLSIGKHLGKIQETEGSEVSNIIRLLELARRYLLNKTFRDYEMLQAERIFDDIPNLEIYETPQIILDLALEKNEGKVATFRGIEKEVYYSKEENRLYILTGVSLLSGIMAKEISRIFRWADKDVFPFLNSIIPVIEDDEALATQLSLFGLVEEGESYESPDKIELLPEEKKEELEAEPEEKLRENSEEEKEEKKVEPPKPQKPHKGLLVPDEYYPSTAKGYEPYKDVEGGDRQISKEINLREGKPEKGRPPKEAPDRRGRKDAEGIAILIALYYEASQEREAEDRHRQRGIGYDVYSRDAEGEERFIEVKHFGQEEGPFELKPHQLKKAEKEGNKYYVYVVKGLKEGTKPRIYIIQDPIKWLTPDPPIQKKYSEWKNAVKSEIDFEKT